MDYLLKNLDECMFDYLVYNKDKPKSFIQMWADIRGDSGYRCSELWKKGNESESEFRFYNMCYTLPSNYKNIYKFYIHDTLYLVYTLDTNLEPLKRNLLGNATGFPDDKSLLNKIMKLGSTNKQKYMFTGSLLENAIKTSNCEILQSLTKIWAVDFYDDGDRMDMLKVALQKPNLNVLSLIIDTYFVQQIDYKNYGFNDVEIGIVGMVRDSIKKDYTIQIMGKSIEDLTKINSECKRDYDIVKKMKTKLDFDNRLLIKKSERYMIMIFGYCLFRFLWYMLANIFG
jgi:hypothetical protein